MTVSSERVRSASLAGLAVAFAVPEAAADPEPGSDAAGLLMSSWNDGNASAGGAALAFREKTVSAELTNAANTSAPASARMRLGFMAVQNR